MRKTTHDGRLSLAVSNSLLARARQHADARGMTMPELVRHALRQTIKDAA